MLSSGVHFLNIDAKGRVAIPPEHREVLAATSNNEVVVTIEKSGCLMVFPVPEWQEREKKLLAASTNDQQVKAMQRLYLGYAARVSLDTQGRIPIRAALKKFAALEKKVALVGLGHKLELWDEARWEEYQLKGLDMLPGEGVEVSPALDGVWF